MSINKKKSPGRPKKEFISKKPKTAPKSGPGRPRKEEKLYSSNNQVSPAIKLAVAKSVDDSKKKDIIILALFLLSFVLFVVSVYFTFMKDKKGEVVNDSDIAEIVNIETGNIDYTTEETEDIKDQEPSIPSIEINDIVQQTTQN
ncbi:MAG TPA: hypothetical protein PKC87_04750, partial [Candidatus Absconditabacterales bacterium]|nr:hypothetical protein [Candidatus Absconditabacterales bacterium]